MILNGHKRAFCAVLAALAVAVIATGCKSANSTDTALSGGSPAAVSGTAGSVSSTAGTTVGSVGTGGTVAAGGYVAAGGTGATTAGGAPLTRCPAEKPVCAGLTDCPLANCYKVSKEQMPATCSCLSGSALSQCCAEVETAMGNCPDMAKYPECVKAAQCPATVLQSLVTNPVKGVNGAISKDCQSCLCTNCGQELSETNTHGASAIAFLQCAVAKGGLRDCLVCDPVSPCDVTLGTNLMTGLCSQEVMNACPSCRCTGMFDLNCLSLASCLVADSAKRLPCAAAHATAECMASKCPMCAQFGACPSNLSQIKPGTDYP